MPERATIQRAKQKLRRGRSASTAAGEFVREEMHHIREGKHGARSTKQAIAIGLSKARRAGVPLRAPKRGTARTPRAPSRTRSRAVRETLRREPRRAASHRALASQAHRSAAQRGRRARSEAARKAVRTKGPRLRSAAARKAAATRKRSSSRRSPAARSRA
jgi:hypothetical protein